MIDHVDIRVSDFAASRAFYEAALEPLGMGVLHEAPDPNGGAEVGFGTGDDVRFALHEPTAHPGQDAVTHGAHIAFEAADQRAVAAFHRAAIARGGTDIGAPGRRPEYSPGYYGAFVLDLDGNNVEAVCRIDPATEG
jgi:catechol 2,3-dioxygenase-like lactoylglutathione lyase family enzyme